MLFNSQAFAVFFAVVFAAFWLLRNAAGARNVLLLGSSYFFYGYWDWRFLALIVFSTVLDFSVGRALGRTDAPARRRLLLGLSLCGNLGLLGFFKYWNFFAEELARMLGTLGLAADPLLLDVALPVGISFYTFQTLSYTIDVYRRELEPEPELLRFAIFVAFFPQLVAGPIVRARSFLPQLRRPPSVTQDDFESGLLLAFTGLFKKIVVADYLGRVLVDPFWEAPGSYGSWGSLLAIYAYAFQIYCDFSGYSDIAIGVARTLGFDLGRNFRSPYRAGSPQEFWSRWHISLSTWLRDYLYVSLGGNRRGRLRTLRNLMLTMLLGGLWHGASWMFVLWGLYHGLLLVVHRLLPRREPRGRPWGALRCLFFFQLVCLGWVLFRSADGAAASAVLASLAEPFRGGIPRNAYLVLILAALMHFPSDRIKGGLRRGFLGLPGWVQGLAYALLVGLLMNVHSQETPFIYFQF